MSEENKLELLQQAVRKFLEDIKDIPPWESAGAAWTARIKELHSAWLDSLGVPR